MLPLLLALSVVSGGGYVAQCSPYQYQYQPPYYPPVIKFFAVEPNKYYLDIVAGGQRQDQQQTVVNQFIQSLNEYNQNVKEQKEQRDQEAERPADPDDVPIPIAASSVPIPPRLTVKAPIPTPPGKVKWVPPPVEVVTFLKNDCSKCHTGPKANKGFKIFEGDGKMSVLDAQHKLKIDAAIANQEMPPSGKDLRGKLPVYRDWISKDPNVLELLKKRTP